MPIPVENIYFLLCYAWDEFAPKQIDKLAAEAFPDSLHLFARMLVAGIESLHKRGFERGYLVEEEATSSPRGRIVVAESMRLLATQPARLWCAFDELSVDVPTNRILKASLRNLLGTEDLGLDLKGEVRRAWRLFEQVGDVRLTGRMFYEVRVHQNNKLYAFLLNVCRFLWESLQPAEKEGQYRFQDVMRDAERLRRVYEKFVRSFYFKHRAQHGYQVKRDQMKWLGEPLDGADYKLLPELWTDVTLRSPGRTIVIECKYTESMFQTNYGKKTFRSAHLNQLAAYLRNMDSSTEGVLLYPTAGTTVDSAYVLQDRRVRIRTLNLAQSWQQITADLLSLII